MFSLQRPYGLSVHPCDASGSPSPSRSHRHVFRRSVAQTFAATKKDGGLGIFVSALISIAYPLNLQNMTGLSALVLGGTGAAGSVLLQEVLASPLFSCVGEYGRRVTSADKILNGKEKLKQNVIDFDKLEQSGLKDGRWDVVFIALGKSSIEAGSAAEFEKVDREYVINAARAAKSDDPFHFQRLVYISSAWANPSSPFRYFRSKGLTERALARVGYDEVVFFRPAGFGEVRREVTRPLERAVSIAAGTLYRITGNPYFYMPVPRLAKCMRMAGESGTRGLQLKRSLKFAGEPGMNYMVLVNRDILAISSQL